MLRDTSQEKIRFAFMVENAGDRLRNDMSTRAFFKDYNTEFNCSHSEIQIKLDKDPGEWLKFQKHFFKKPNF